MFTYAFLSEAARVSPQIAFTYNVSGFAYSNPQAGLLGEVLSVQVLSPATAVTIPSNPFHTEPREFSRKHEDSLILESDLGQKIFQ